MASLLETVSQPTRREILSHLWHQELSAGDIHKRVGTVTFGAISQHLRVLSEAGLVEVSPVQQLRIYRIRRGGFGPLAAYFDAFWGNALDRLAAVAESEQAKSDAGRAKSEGHAFDEAAKP
jgi:DNA-binding transcriptional ArsR family regulator